MKWSQGSTWKSAKWRCCTQFVCCSCSCYQNLGFCHSLLLLSVVAFEQVVAVPSDVLFCFFISMVYGQSSETKRCDFSKHSSSLNRPHFNKAIDRSCADPQDRQILKMLLGKKTGGSSPAKNPRIFVEVFRVRKILV